MNILFFFNTMEEGVREDSLFFLSPFRSAILEAPLYGECREASIAGRGNVGLIKSCMFFHLKARVRLE